MSGSTGAPPNGRRPAVSRSRRPRAPARTRCPACGRRRASIRRRWSSGSAAAAGPWAAATAIGSRPPSASATWARSARATSKRCCTRSTTPLERSARSARSASLAPTAAPPPPRSQPCGRGRKPEAMHRILIADSLDPSGLALFADSGAEIVELREADRPRLAEIIGDFDALVVRSATKVTAELLHAAKRLKVVGRAGIGVDNVDVAAATEQGVVVVNAPTANLLSATEHTFALLLAVARRVPEADASTKAGGWNRKLTGVELQGKTLGVIGFGRIGQRVAKRAHGFEMKVVTHDPFLDPAAARRLEVEMLPLADLLRRSPAITVHTPLTEQTRHLLAAPRLQL